MCTSTINSLLIFFLFQKTEKAVESRRKNNDNRTPSSIDPRWPPGRRRKTGERVGKICRRDDRGTHLGHPRRVEPGHSPLCTSKILGLFIFLFLIASARAICPSKCVCNDKLLKAVCENSNLEVVPIQLNPEIETLNLNNNRIGNVHMTFIFYTHLVDLDLSANKIKSLGSKNFEFQMNLVKLNVSHNAITDLHRDSFKGLIKLAVLDLSGNQIEEINDRMSFKDLRNLQELNLSKNNIYVIETGVFDHLIDLKRLILSENQLMKIPDNAINNLGNLIEIDLNSNLIDDLLFPVSLKSLEVLRFRSNLIRTLDNETFDNLPRLRKLDLSDNNFTQVPSFQFSKLNNLEYLNLSSNMFDHLDAKSFRGLYKLREIHIDGAMSLSAIDSRAFSENINLNYVSLSNNPNLNRLPKFLFLNKPNLKHVRISGNHFSTLDASDLPLDQLETLTLGRNPFNCNCSLHWLWILKERQVLRNCTCTETSCFEGCVENLPKSEKLVDYKSEEEEEDAASESQEEEETGEKNSRFSGFTYDKDLFPIILDLDEIYCEGQHKSGRMLLKKAPKSDFDCTTTWMVILTAALLAILFILLLTAIVYVLANRCKRKVKNPVENFINAAKDYEDTHHTYYRYGETIGQNGNVFEVLKSGQDKLNREKPLTNVYIKSPMDRQFTNYASDFNSRVSVADTLYKKQYANPQEFYGSSPVSNYVSDTNIYQEPFVSPVKTKNPRPPHIVYV
ncbi:hypothetical protein RUM43_012317 [Polyplax serrata]|uniref:Uncharacterized protein n=1 Tax=Polyplax serrata TaxID=468196 RepID=A0AAN8NX17_POLSC